jgi:hypothetical protein
VEECEPNFGRWSIVWSTYVEEPTSHIVIASTTSSMWELGVFNGKYPEIFLDIGFSDVVRRYDPNNKATFTHSTVSCSPSLSAIFIVDWPSNLSVGLAKLM